MELELYIYGEIKISKILKHATRYFLFKFVCPLDEYRGHAGPSLGGSPNFTNAWHECQLEPLPGGCLNSKKFFGTNNRTDFQQQLLLKNKKNRFPAFFPAFFQAAIFVLDPFSNFWLVVYNTLLTSYYYLVLWCSG